MELTVYFPALTYHELTLFLYANNTVGNEIRIQACILVTYRDINNGLKLTTMKMAAPFFPNMSTNLDKYVSRHRDVVVFCGTEPLDQLLRRSDAAVVQQERDHCAVS